MQLCQNWRPLLASLETYIETSGDLSPICYLSNKYATESPAILGAALTQIGALLGQAQQIIHQVGSGEPAVDAALPEKAAADVECAPDGSWLRVGNRALRRIRGRQQDFVLTMVEAYKKGNRRPKIEWVLRKARYAEGLYDLRHISKRPAFLAFFGQEDGECWIVADPAVESAQAGKV